MAVKSTKKAYQIILDVRDNEALEKLASDRRCPKSVLIREIICSYIKHAGEKQPTCADGHACLCPGMWNRVGKTTTAQGA